MATVCEEGIANAVEVMRLGMLNRYQMDAGAETNYLLKCERAVTNYIGTKYCIGLNSGASAIFLALKCGGLPRDAPVLSNAFTFNAVPSAIHHAGGKAVLVECTESLVVDLEDLEVKAVESGAKFFVLSYMRGRIPNMDDIMALCQKHGLYLIEDSAHAYGCEWKGQKIGTFGHSSTMSTQANKVMNSGEGGFLLTDDDHIMAKAIISAGSYEELYLKHCELSPPAELMKQYRMTEVNFSVRMAYIKDAILLPQVAQIDIRREKHNTIYEKITTKLSEHPRISIPTMEPDVTPVYDSLQFSMSDVTKDQILLISKRVKELAGIKLDLFGLVENARNWRTWRFLDDVDDLHLPKTEKIIQATVDTRLSYDMTDTQIEVMVATIHRAIDEATQRKRD